jgi:soluble lytic murein transglycosylase-like protein
MAALLLASLPARAEQKQLVVRANRKTGKLVTAVAGVKSQSALAAPAANIAGLIEEAARANGVDPLLVHSVIQVESNYNPYAVSPKGAQGLMQLMPATARTLGVGNSFDPRENIEAGVRYLKQLQDAYQDDRLALAAYNAGPGAVKKHRQVPPYPETQAYVKRVGERYVEARKGAGLAPAAPVKENASTATAQAPEVMTEEKHPRLEHYVDEHGRLHLRTALE